MLSLVTAGSVVNKQVALLSFVLAAGGFYFIATGPDQIKRVTTPLTYRKSTPNEHLGKELRTPESKLLSNSAAEHEGDKEKYEQNEIVTSSQTESQNEVTSEMEEVTSKQKEQQQEEDENSCQTPLPQNFCKKNTCLKHSRANWHMTVTAEQYKLSHCVILKDVSTIMMGIMCYLAFPKFYAEEGKHLYEERWIHRTCKRMNEQPNLSKTLYDDDSWVHLAVVRDPLERFLSGWIDKCYKKYEQYGNGRFPGYCYDCGKDLPCFVRRFHRKMFEHKAKRLTRNFINENHFWPQSWYCAFNKRLEKYHLIYYDPNDREGFYDDLAEALRVQSVPGRMIEFVVSQGLNKSTSHTLTGGSLTDTFKPQLYADKTLMRLLMQVFYKDYEMFGFQKPCLDMDI